MGQAVLIGIDLGTSGCKLVAFSEHGQTLAATRRPLVTSIPAPGQAEQEAGRWWQAVSDGLRDLLACQRLAHCEVLGIGICGHFPSLVLLDACNHPLRPAILWKDARGILPPGLAAGELASRLRLPSPYLPTLPITKLAWLQHHEPDLFAARQIGRCLGAKDTLVFYMTGRATTDPVEAWWSGLAGARGAAWDAELVDRVGLPLASLPEIAFSPALAGRVSPLAAAATGLPSGTPVAVGTGDGVCCMLGANLQQPGDGVVIHGSSAIVATLAPQGLHFSGSDAIMRFPPVVADGADLLYSSTPSGAADPFVRRLLRGQELSCVRQQALALPPTVSAPLFIPHLEGVTSPWLNLDLRGAWLNLAVDHNWPELYRGVLDGMVFSVRQILDALSDLGAPLRSVQLAGGGAQNRGLCQLYADVLGRPVARLARPELGCLGAAMLAAVAAEVYPDLSAAAMAMKGELELIEPAGNARVFEERYAVYRRTCAWLEECSQT